MGYRQVYFRINSKYAYGSGWSNDDKAAEAFKEETRRLFQEAGWTLQISKNKSVCDTAVKGQQDLYLHPMNFSGVILEEDIPTIEALLAKAATFQCRGTDCYETYLELSDEDYWALLETQKAEITAVILEQFKTKRRNLYKSGEAAMNIAQRFTVRRLCDKEGNRNKANLYVSQLIESLIAEGRLITARTKNGTGIRTATKAEWQEHTPPLVDKDYLSRPAG